MYHVIATVFITASIIVSSTALLYDGDYLEIKVPGEAAVFSGQYMRRSAPYKGYPVYEKKCDDKVCDCQCFPMGNITQENCQVTGWCFVDSSSAGCGDLIPTRRFPQHPKSSEACTHPSQQNKACSEQATYTVMFVNDEGLLTITEMFDANTAFRSKVIINYPPPNNSSWTKLKRVEGETREGADWKVENEWKTILITVSSSVKNVSVCGGDISRDVPTMAVGISVSLCALVLLSVVACILIKRRRGEEVAEIENNPTYGEDDEYYDEHNNRIEDANDYYQ